jgi:selenocysteine-specific elongation factor
VRRFVLGTAGHVDHGKTTLVRALTGVDTDRLPEEKRRGITIELGFAPWQVADDMHVSIIDVPGHRRLVHTMIAGAVGMELVLLVVAADEGVMPQTREHIAACELLGLRRAVVAVTKVDRVGEELASLAREEAKELLGSRFETEIALCSARTGEGIEGVRAAVRRSLLALGPRPASSRARLSVDRVFSVRGAGTVVTGTLVEGKIALGAPLFVVGAAGARETSARALHIHDHPFDVAEAPTRLALNLAGLTREDVARGDVVTDDPSVAPTRLLDVSLRAGAKLRSGASASVYIGTARSTARIDLLRAGEAVAEGTEANADRETVARLRLGDPLVAIGGDRFVLRGSDVEGPAGAVLGGGAVLDARPPRARPRGKRRAVLEGLDAADAVATLRALVAESAPRPLRVADLRARFPMPVRDLEKAADLLLSRSELAKLKGPMLLPRAALLEAAASARALVAEHHARAPFDRGLGRETLRQRLGERMGLEAAEEAIRIAASAQGQVALDPIVLEGDVARSSTFGSSAAAAATAGPVEAVTRAVIDAGLRGVTELSLKEVTSASPKEIKTILAKLVREGAAIRAGELWFHKPAVDDLRARVVSLLERTRRMTVGDFKELSGLGRKQAIPLLELFDRELVTRREGDDRVPGRG